IKQWDARFGGSENDNLMSLQQISDGGYILAGRTSSEKSGDVSQESKGIEDYWIVKTDINGIKQWDARFGGSSYELLNAAEETEDDGFILGGSSPSPSGGDKSQNSQGDVDYWIIKVAAPLPPVTCYVPDGTFTSGINTTLATVNWNAVSSANKYKVRYRVAGTAGWITISAVKNYKTLNGLSAGNSYEWQVKSICKELDLGNSDWSPIQIFTTLPQKSTDAPLSEKEIFSVYPNPVSSSAVIEFFLSNTSALKIDLFDIQGRKIKTIDEGNFEAGNYQLHFERNNLPSGIYFLRLKADTHITTQKLIVQ
ncbi:MAG TPA: T9SS type A sorting domain-containing protein, partial [Chitinophagales bacterium]|nr:T9SS type A sorting domain-containing protein [Chitinophagales bacterium]